jgi:hypothetical protein
MFVGVDMDDTVARLRAHAAELLGEVARYENVFRLCYLRGRAGIIVALAEQIGESEPADGRRACLAAQRDGPSPAADAPSGRRLSAAPHLIRSRSCGRLLAWARHSTSACCGTLRCV